MMASGSHVMTDIVDQSDNQYPIMGRIFELRQITVYLMCTCMCINRQLTDESIMRLPSTDSLCKLQQPSSPSEINSTIINNSSQFSRWYAVKMLIHQL